MSEKDKKLAAGELEWEEVRTEHVIKDKWIDFRKTAYRMPDGKVYEPYYTYSRRHYTVIVASDTEGRFICVKQFRQGVRRLTTEFPAGGIERADGMQYGEDRSGAEDALVAAKRELTEETGYESDEWEQLCVTPSNATISDNYAYIFRARTCRKVTGQDLDDLEFLNVKLYTADEIEDMINKGEFEQAVHALAWLMAARKMTE